jgi:membrane associated rhomboid family serine protease/tetratricopeptide (TPR) repeat protein
VIIEVQRRSHVQQMTYEDFEQRIRDGEIDARTRVRFEVVTGEDFVPAGDLELFQALADPRHMAFRRNLSRPGIPIVTAILIGVQIRVYLSSWAPEAKLLLQEHLTNWGPAILEQGEVWRLLSYGLLHVGFTHLLFNLCFLAYTGYHLERAMGRANLAVLFFGSVFTGGLLSMAMAPERASLGASGGDFGLLAATVIVGWKYWESIPVRARKYFGWALAPYLGFSILSGIQAENVDNWSHLGGLIGGAVLVTLLEPELLAARRVVNTRWRAVAIGLMAVLGLAIAVRGVWLVPLTAEQAEGWAVSRPAYWQQGWTFTGDRGWFSPTLQANLSTTTTTHPRPLGPDEAADALIERVTSDSREATVVSREPAELAGLEARRLVLQFDLYGQQQEVIALVATRGLYEHRVQFQSVAEAAGRYQPLVERVASSVELTEVPELVEARGRAGMHPRSAEPASALGRALYRSGDPEGALRAYEKSLGIDPRRVEAIAGRLRVYADYPVPGGAQVAREALAAWPLEPQVVVAAADALAGAGEEAAAVEALDQAWRDLPGDRTLRRARLRRGLPVALPSQGDDG